MSDFFPFFSFRLFSFSFLPLSPLSPVFRGQCQADVSFLGTDYFCQLFYPDFPCTVSLGSEQQGHSALGLRPGGLRRFSKPEAVEVDEMGDVPPFLDWKLPFCLFLYF